MGTAAGLNCPVRLIDTANPHLLEVGMSGFGKTFAMQRLEKSLAFVGAEIIVLNYNSTHSHLQADEEAVIHWDISEKGLPFPLFSAFKRPDGSREDLFDIVESVVDVLGRVHPLQSRQRAALRSAVRKTLERHGEQADFNKLAFYLENTGEEVPLSIWEKFAPLFEKIKFTRLNGNLLESGKILVLDMDKFTSQLQCFASELILAVLWRWFQLWGQFAKRPLYVVCDECQNLSLKKNSVLSQVLREGRKFNIGVLLATQSLTSFSKEQVSVIMQAATQLYFHPAPNEARTLARLTGVEDIREMERKLMGLRRGECIGVGRFRVGSMVVEHPVKICI